MQFYVFIKRIPVIQDNVHERYNERLFTVEQITAVSGTRTRDR